MALTNVPASSAIAMLVDANRYTVVAFHIDVNPALGLGGTEPWIVRGRVECRNGKGTKS